MFYTFDQSNPGGRHHIDEAAGLSVKVIIEATSPSAANNRAETLGIYFDGVDAGRDCSCCGDRWYRVGQWGAEDPGTVEPEVAKRVVHPGDGFPAKDEAVWLAPMRWAPEGTPEGFIHYADGRIEGFWATTNARQDLDGTYGWGVSFNRHEASVFVVGKNGYDESGNQFTVGHLNDDWRSKPAWAPPTEATVEVAKEYAYGAAWFPTEAEAQAFAAEFRRARRMIRDRQRQAIAAVSAKTEDEHVIAALAIWHPTKG